MNGWIGKVLRVDLSSKDYSVEELSPVLAKEYIGARGLGSKILFDELDPTVEPLSPQNKLIIVTGALTGTGASSTP